ncbi:hypothetical protein BaRGS_00000060 [Batillaria attramentaria]|uniref:Malate dehydrogenase n=1 Tax=Batillaria attramentaria TaxID=370345 RepID=A0ABD0MAW9_9CAEN
MSLSSEDVVISKHELHAYVVRSCERMGVKTGHASAMADLLVAADYRGLRTHGFNNLKYYMDQLLTNKIALDKEPEIIKQTVATALVDGNNVLGHVVGNFAMDLAIQKAKEAGVGWVTVKGSNHFGIAGWYSTRASEQGLVGLAFTNGPPFAVPTRARKATLSTNPISVAAPANNGDSMVLDMATTTSSYRKLEMKALRNEPVPIGWAVDSEGKVRKTVEHERSEKLFDVKSSCTRETLRRELREKLFDVSEKLLDVNFPTTDPRVLFQGGNLMPLGGLEETSGYKGYGLGMMVEVFCGILSGGAFGPFTGRYFLGDESPDVIPFEDTIDPKAFAPGFPDRMSQLLDHCRNLQPAEGDSEVLVPGDLERQHMSMCDTLGGIPYKPKLIQDADKFAAEHGIEPLKRKS